MIDKPRKSAYLVQNEIGEGIQKKKPRTKGTYKLYWLKHDNYNSELTLPDACAISTLKKKQLHLLETLDILIFSLT